METKITRLRNLMTPVVNYFSVQKFIIAEGLMMGDSKDKIVRTLLEEHERVINNLPEIRQILSEIPDDAIK